MGNLDKENIAPEGNQEISYNLLTDDQKKDLAHIEKMQKGWSRAVAMKSKEMMAQLLLKGLIPMVRDENGKIIACFYEHPLNNEDDIGEKVYRIGGLVSDQSFQARRALIDLATQETKKFSDGFGVAILNTSNSRVVKMLTELGWTEVDYKECRERHPRELELYLKDSGIPEENYRDEKFYILKKN